MHYNGNQSKNKSNRFPVVERCRLLQFQETLASSEYWVMALPVARNLLDKEKHQRLIVRHHNPAPSV